MSAKRKGEQAFFEQLCEEYYERVLRYLFYSLHDETAARDCTQEVFLVALQKCALLQQHPNPGGFLLQTAKNLSCKAKRQSLRKLLTEAEEEAVIDDSADVQNILDQNIDESEYIPLVLSRLAEDKLQLYAMRYLGDRDIHQIALQLGVEEAAVRMRLVRLRREIRQLVEQVALENFTM